VSERADLEQILQTALALGVQVHRAGGYTARTDMLMKRVALALGADKADPAITATLVGLTVTKNDWSRTAFRSAVFAGVNFSELTELSRLAKDAEGKTAEEVRTELDTIKATSKRYGLGTVIPAVGVGSASLAALFGADPAGMLITGVAGAIGALLRAWLMKRHFKPFVFSLFCAFLSVAIVMVLRDFTNTVQPALAASVLYLVPGVPLLNGTADLLTGYYLNGLVRLTMSSVVFVGASVGLLAALTLWGLA
jgi:uncharacterized membrane protein YjjP (DUF1212 family)